jgi:hypothetical protein
MRRLALSSSVALLMLATACSESANKAASTDDVKTVAAEPGPSSQPAAQEAVDANAPARGTTPATRDQVDDDGIVRRGVDLTSTAAMSVADCTAQAKDLNGKPVKVSGTVEQVCAAKGCWWVLAGEPGQETIRITAKSYGFFVPKDAKGKKAIAEGVLEVKELSQEEADHLAEDAKDPSMKTKKMELRLEASALEMRS